MTKAEALEQLAEMTQQLAEMTQQRDEALARVEKLIGQFDADAEHWFSISDKLDGEPLSAALDERNTLKERLAGNMLGKGHLSEKFCALRQVTDQVWRNANPDDASSHPSNNVAETALIKRGWSESLAKSGASIIRPEWAHRGRQKEE